MVGKIKAAVSGGGSTRDGGGSKQGPGRGSIQPQASVVRNIDISLDRERVASLLSSPHCSTSA